MLKLFFLLNIKILLVITVFGIVMSKTRQIAVGNFVKKTHGYLIIDLFNLIGTPVHELGHLFFGLLFGYQVDQICLFRSTKKARRHGGTLGFVKMHHKTQPFYKKMIGDIGQFFIGIGPLIFGPLIIYGLSRLLPAHLRSLPSSFRAGMDIFVKNLHLLTVTDIIVLFVFLYIILGISLNLELSRQDLDMAYKGLFLLEILFFLISALSQLFGWNLNSSIDAIFRWNLTISTIGIAASLMANLISIL